MKKSKSVFYAAEALTADDSSDPVIFQNGITNVSAYLKVTGGAVGTTFDVDIEVSPDGTDYYVLKSFTQITGATGSEVIRFNNTTEHFLPYVRAVVDLGTTLQGSVTCELHYDII